MKRTTRIALSIVVIATAALGVIAALAHSELFAIVAAGCAVVALVAALPPGGRHSPGRAAAARSGYDPTTSATVDILLPSRPPAFQSSGGPSGDPQRAPVPSSPECAEIALAPLYAQPIPRATAPTRMPVGTEPREVVASLLIAAASAGRPVSAHLWLEDPATDTLRLVEAQGTDRPLPVPVSGSSGLLGTALAERTAQIGPLESATRGSSHSRVWRYAVPLSGSDLRGVAAVDFEGDSEPDRATLTSVSAALRASLTGALALHVARAEAETARILVKACSQLARILDPDDVLRAALDRAMELDSAQSGSIMILDSQTRKMHIAVAHGLPEDIVENTSIAEGDGIAGWVLASKQPLVIEDLTEAGIRSRRHGIRSAVCVPLADEQGMVGVLNVGCTSFHARISRAHLRTLEALGRSIVVALRSSWKSDGAQDLYFGTLKALALALEARDPYSRGSVGRILELVEALGTYFGVSEDEAKALRIAAMLHDVGMSAAGASAPAGDGPLSTVEWGMLKMHPIIAAEIMSQAPALNSVIPLVYHHHEHYDGSGYVSGLAGTQIPRGARILSVVDAYVAMTSGRPYRQTFTHEQALDEITRLAGTQFDPTVVRAFTDVVGSPA